MIVKSISKRDMKLNMQVQECVLQWLVSTTETIPKGYKSWSQKKSKGEVYHG